MQRYRMQGSRLPPVITLLALAVAGVPGYAQHEGMIAGAVFDQETGAPLPYANIVVLGTMQGGIGRTDGSFQVVGIRPGHYSVQASFIGYKAQTQVVDVLAGRIGRLTFRLPTDVFEADEIVVEGAPLVDAGRAVFKHEIDSADLRKLPLDDVNEAIALKAGVINQGGELHFRGGRGSEVQTYIDGMPVRDPLGQSHVTISSAALSRSEVILGGFEAEFGNAQSGIVRLETREGREEFSGEFRYYTDDYGAPDRTFTNFDRVSVGFGGPVNLPQVGWLRGLTYYLSYEGTFEDTYLRTTERRNRRTLFDLISIGGRQSVDVKLQGKLAYKASPRIKLTFEYLNNRRQWDSYDHRWSRSGFVEILDTFDAEERAVRQYGRFTIMRPEGEEGIDYIPFNGPEHTPNNEEIYEQQKIVFRHSFSPTAFYDLRLSRASFNTETRVLDQQPWEYEQSRTAYWVDSIHNESEPFFVTNGDYPRFYQRDNKVYIIKTDWMKKARDHTVKWGAQGIYNDLQVLSLVYPNRSNTFDTYGLDKTAFHYYNPEGSLYLQDRWEHEGMVLNFGLRYDIFSVGQQIHDSEVSERVKTQFSPRLGVAFPISDRDVLSFMYGRYFQLPNRNFIFEDRGTHVEVRGNPDLDAETTISYQFGVQHVFAPSLVGQFSVYFKDIFGLLTTRLEEAPGSPDPVPIYVNRDYASSRGFEASIEKRFSHNFSATFDYTFGRATGVASDEEETLRDRDELLYLPISEQPLNWDQRHTMSATLLVSEPANWSTSFIWRYGSGLPFTPTARLAKTLDPKDRNTSRLPSTVTLDVQGDKYLRIWEQDVTLFLQALNVLDARNIRDLTPSIWPYGLPSNEELIDYRAYYTETGQAGGAYLGDDRDGDGVADWVPLHDPRVYAPGRVVRVGVGLVF